MYIVLYLSIPEHGSQNFIKFINMMMIDTTFLLDMSLDAL